MADNPRGRLQSPLRGSDVFSIMKNRKPASRRSSEQGRLPAFCKVVV
jgi:hypothetical protein